MKFAFEQLDLVNHDLKISLHTTAVSHNYVPSHWHKALEIIYLLSGSLEVTINGHTSFLEAGQGILVNSRVVHSNLNRYGNKAIVLLIPEDFILNFADTEDTILFPDFSESSYKKELINILLKMKELQESSNHKFQFTFYALVLQFLDLLSKEASLIPANQNPIPGNQQEALLQNIISYTKEHYTEPISLKEISDIAHLHPQYFCRFFKRAMGQTFTEYLNELRLAAIYLDIISSTETIHAIRQKHGFSNYKIFRRMFHEKFQCTPTELRNIYLTT